MGATLAMMAALAFVPAQAGELTLTNVRPTYGLHGPTRKDADAPKLRAPDAFVLSFEIEGLKVSEDGRVQYSIGMEVTNKDGKVLYGEKPVNQEAVYALGGKSVWAYVAAGIGTDVTPGEYALTAMVTDRAAKTTKKLTRKYQVLPAGFGISGFSLIYDNKDRTPAPPVGVPGQSLVVNFIVTGFERKAAEDKKSKQPHVTVSMRVLENGKPTLTKDQVGVVKEVSEKFSALPITFGLALNRAGKFTVELKAIDEFSKKSATQTFDLRVVEVK